MDIRLISKRSDLIGSFRLLMNTEEGITNESHRAVFQNIGAIENKKWKMALTMRKPGTVGFLDYPSGLDYSLLEL